MSKYFIYREHTLCYLPEGGWLYGVLASSVVRGGYDPTRGSICVTDPENLRPATPADFEEYRCLPPKGLFA